MQTPELDDIVVRQTIWWVTSDNDNGLTTEVYQTEEAYLERLKGELESQLESYADDPTALSKKLTRWIAKGRIEDAFDLALDEEFFNHLDSYHRDRTEVLIRRSQLPGEGDLPSADRRMAILLLARLKKWAKQKKVLTDEVAGMLVDDVFRELFGRNVQTVAEKTWVLEMLCKRWNYGPNSTYRFLNVRYGVQELWQMTTKHETK